MWGESFRLRIIDPHRGRPYFYQMATAHQSDPADPVQPTSLRHPVKGESARRWQEENREAIASRNQWIEENGLPLARYRLF